MSEESTRSDSASAAEVRSTGHEIVDAVLRSLQSLDDTPVAEHVAVFDRAHGELRQALNDAGRGSAPDAR